MTDTTTDYPFAWVDAPPGPPAGPGRPRIWVPRLERLKEQPGKWADFGPAHAKVATNINSGLHGFTKGDYHAVTRTIDGERHLFAMYNGNGNGPTAA